MTALAVAQAVRTRQRSAAEAVEDALAAIAAGDARINAFTAVLGHRAREKAAALDARIAAGDDPGPLAGVPFAAKNLFDLAGVVTLAGSTLLAARPPAARDAYAVRALEAAGAVCVGALAMDEFAYGFTTENSHYGPTRNPHDTQRIAGGSSGGSAAAVAAGLVPLSLGTDTNGSIRVPASLCGVYGIKPTFGRVSRAGAFPFVAAFDHIGPFARGVADLEAAYAALCGADPDDPAQGVPEIVRVPDAPRIARLGGWFARRCSPAARDATDRVAAALGAEDIVEWPMAEAARAAAFLITSAEGGALHLPSLRDRLDEYEPLIQDRLLAGALLPAVWVARAQRVRAQARASMRTLLARYDVLVAPATPVAATPIGQATLEPDGEVLPLRPSLGLFTQPISCIGLPVVTVPIPRADGALPIGVQLIGAPWAEATLLAAAARLEAAGVCAAPVAAG